ncbi:diguanylate cyclase [Marinobacterium lacunae]|uniref:cyclic-guanylate-specific phosphodiesterase n=1 Tax=Marinobacterium lacunae TaxID=1232683 RepID=A0A081FZ11_9GAMM|nr:EAL domain-containing response regulator [Marinobacterium lacunae]KEA63766.1 diguanylate cyclase [Marinobacterium lacunae]
MVELDTLGTADSRILVVDDDLSTRLALVKILRKEGYDVYQACGGQEALDYLSTHPLPDLVVLDVVMPDVDGYAVCRTLRALDRNLPVVMLTGLDDMEAIDRAFSCGATDFVTKPINWALLIPRVRYSLRTYRMTQALDKVRMLQSEAQEVARLGFFEWDPKLNRLSWSSRLIELFGLPDPVRNLGIEGYLNRVVGEQVEYVSAQLREVAEGIQNKVTFEHDLSGDEGERRIRAIARRTSPESILCVLQDITDFYTVSQTVEFQRDFDTLTRMANRVKFYSLVEDELDSKVPCAVVTIDIDRFHMINDSLGQAAGDKLLQLFSLRLNAATYGFYSLARLGADEFAVLIPEVEGVTTLVRWVETLQARMNEAYELDGQLVFMETCIGIALSPEHATDSHHLISAAIQARLVAKQSGSSRFKVYDESCQQNFARRLYIESELRYALERGQFTLFYQPQFDLRLNRVVGVEALIRWQHPEMGFVPPMEFIPIAEQMELIHAIGYWVAEEAISQAARWHRQGVQLRMGINLSARQFSDERLADKLGRMLKKAGLPTEYLDVEITESVAMESPERVLQLLAKLQEQGVKVAIDDFGTGYSSLEYLQKFDVEFIKIDQAFVRNLLGNKADQGIVKAVLGIAESLEMRVIAEGVESAEELELLRALGCDEIQGYYISRPLPPAEIEPIIEGYNQDEDSPV